MTSLSPVERSALQSFMRQIPSSAHGDDWQDAYLSALSACESGADNGWAKKGRSVALLAVLGPLLISGSRLDINRARELILIEMQGYAKQKADEVNDD